MSRHPARPLCETGVRARAGRWHALWGLGLVGLAHAQEPSDSDSDTAEAVSASQVDADDDAMVVIVQTDGRVPRAAGSAWVVDEKELEQFEYDDLHRVLSRVPGVYLRGEEGFGLRPNIGIRGANSDRSSRVTLMEDGVLFAPGPYAAPAAYYVPMTTRMVGVEVFKGPAATRFGPSTVGGAINLRTRSVPTDGATAMADVAYGMRNTLKVHGVVGVGDARKGILVEGVHLGTDGFKQLDGGGPTGFERSEAMLKARLANDPDRTVRHRVELKLGVAHEQSNETYLGLTEDDFEESPWRRYAATARDRMQWIRSQAQLSWQVDVGDRATVRTVAYHHRIVRQWFKFNRIGGEVAAHDLLLAPREGNHGALLDVLRGDADTTGPEDTLWLGTNDRRYHSMGVQSVGRIRAGQGLVNSETEVGIRLHGDIVDRLHDESPYAMVDGRPWATGGDTVITRDSRSTALAFAAHVSEDLGIGPVRVLPGMRLEVIRTTEADTGSTDPAPGLQVVPLPGLGVHASATPWLDVFAGVHRGFSPLAPGQDPEVRPETSVAYELGMRAFPGETFVEAVGFLNDYQNLSGSCTFSGGCTDDQVGQQYNGGKVFVYGIEAVVAQEGSVARGTRLAGELTYTWTGSRFRTGFTSAFPQFGTVEIGDRLPYVPEHQGGARLTLTHPWGHVTAGVSARSAMRDVAGQGAIADDERVDAMGVLDLGVGVRASRHVDLYATLQNVANSVYVESFRPFGLRPGAPIQAMFGVKVHDGRGR